MIKDISCINHRNCTLLVAPSSPEGLSNEGVGCGGGGGGGMWDVVGVTTGWRYSQVLLVPVVWLHAARAQRLRQPPGGAGAEPAHLHRQRAGALHAGPEDGEEISKTHAHGCRNVA